MVPGKGIPESMSALRACGKADELAILESLATISFSGVVAWLFSVSLCPDSLHTSLHGSFNEVYQSRFRVSSMAVVLVMDIPLRGKGMLKGMCMRLERGEDTSRAGARQERGHTRGTTRGILEEYFFRLGGLA